MIEVSLKVRKLAWQVVFGEAGVGLESSDSPHFYACMKLGKSLSTLVGKSGFHALMTRSLTLTKAEVPRLEPIKVTPDLGLHGLNEVHPGLSRDEAIEAESVLIAHILELLFTFFGESITLQLLRDIWPGIFSDEGDSGRGPSV